MSRSTLTRRAARHPVVDSEILTDIVAVETIAKGRVIDELGRLRKRYGKGNWRKGKGIPDIRLKMGETVRAELHWYEATGIGRREFKIKENSLTDTDHGTCEKAPLHLLRRLRV